MGRFEHAEKVGIRDKASGKLIAVYPYRVEGSDTEIEKSVRDWYYKQNCEAEDRLLGAFVDVLEEHEAYSRKSPVEV